MKRRAEYELSKEAVESGDVDNLIKNQTEQNQEENHENGNIEGRKILKIKGPKQGIPQEQPQGNPKFIFQQTENKTINENPQDKLSFLDNLNKSLSSNEQSQQNFSLFNNSQNNKQSQQQEENKKEGPQEQKPSLFGNLLQNQSQTQQQGGLFNNLFNQNNLKNESKTQQKEGETEQKGEETKQQTTGLFTNLQKPEQPSLFSNLTQKTGLFDNPPSTTSSGLFSGGLFAQKPQTTGFSLFSNLQQTNQQSFFSLQQNQNQQSFLQSGKQGSDDEGDDEDTEGDIYKAKSPEREIDTTKENIYDSNIDRLISIKLMKFKLNQNDALDLGAISIEKVKDQDRHMIIFRNELKRILYKGMILKNFTKTSSVNKRDDCLSLTTISENKDDKDKKDKINKDIIKLMFKSKEECDQFQNKLNEILEAKDNKEDK